MIKQIALHHSAVSRENKKSQLLAVDRYHRDKNWGTSSNPFYIPKRSLLGWYVAYNYFIDVDGTTTYTRFTGVEETYAVKGHNCDAPERCDTVSICLAGNFNLELPSDAQIRSLRALMKKLDSRYGELIKTFHRSLQASRTCPGSLFTKDYLNVRILQTSEPTLDKEDKKKSVEIEEIAKKLNFISAILEAIKRKFNLK